MDVVIEGKLSNEEGSRVVVVVSRGVGGGNGGNGGKGGRGTRGAATGAGRGRKPEESEVIEFVVTAGCEMNVFADRGVLSECIGSMMNGQ